MCWKSASNTDQWARAELIGGLVNGVFLVALCLSIFLDAIQRFFEPQEVQNPKVVLVVGGVGLAFNILGLFVFHQHSHHHEEGEHTQDHVEPNELSQAEHGHHEHDHSQRTSTDAQKHLSPTISRQTERSSRYLSHTISSQRRASDASNRSMSRRRSHGRSLVDEFPTHPASVRRNIREHARSPELDAEESISAEGPTGSEAQEPTETTHLLSDPSNRSSNRNYVYPGRDGASSQLNGNTVHEDHLHRQPKEEASGHHGHSHSDMNIRGLFLHVLGDALGNVGVMISALIIWLATSPARYYADPAISLVITLIILKTAVPMCKDTAKPLLQATPNHIYVDHIKRDVEDLSGVRSCHDVHVWALTPSRPIATLHVELDFNFEGANAARYMELAKEINICLHEHGIHSSTIQPEFCLNPQHKNTAPPSLQDRESASSTSTVQTAIATGPSEQTTGQTSSGKATHGHAACLLDCKDTCEVGKQCCGPPQDSSATLVENKPPETEGKSHSEARPK